MFKKILKIFSKILLILFISLTLFLTFDYFFGKLFLDKFIETIKDNPNYHKKQRIRHIFYHHSLAPNIDYKKTGWGPRTYRLCTDEWGLKFKCNKKSKKNYQLAIIGDSFVEGIGFPYEQTFAGLINSKTLPEIANMGVSSYSPKIYYSKIKYFVENGFKFNHIIIYVDVSDLYDDINYNLLSSAKVRDKSWLKRIEWNINAKFPILDNLIFLLTKSKIKLAGDYAFIPNETITELKKAQEGNIDLVYSEKLNLRAVWTYSNENKIKGYDDPIDKAIEEQLRTMDMIHNYLRDRKIKLSIAVYPWPQTILNDVPYNKHVKMWEEFCKRRCANFINHYPIFMQKKDAKKEKIKTIVKYFQLGDVHFSSAGHQAIADDFMRKFKF